MKAQISQLVLDELTIRAECLEDEAPVDASYIHTAVKKMRAGEQLSDNEREAVVDEMKCLETFDTFWSDKSGRRQWLEAAAWLGMLERYNPDAIYSKRPKTAVIDGVRYEV